MSDSIEEKPATGYDRGVDYTEMKDKLVKTFEELNKLYEDSDQIPSADKYIRQITYCLVAIIQLRNASRISEACNALTKFLETDNFNDKVIVKIAKSKSIKYKKGTHEKFVTKTRFRKMLFPITWIEEVILKEGIKLFLKQYTGDLKRRVCDYLLRSFNCNTHSLRYACINYLLYDQKKEMSIVAKFVGHTGVAQLVRYTQLKESDKLFDLDI
jgi:integrase